MRRWLLIWLLVGCTPPHTDRVPQADRGTPSATPAPSGTPAASARVAPEGAAPLTVAQVREHPPTDVATVVAFLCEDRTDIRCPPCPPGANCGACPGPAWLFCDAPTILDPSRVLRVRYVPGVSMVEGQRYRLTGRLVSPWELQLETSRLAE